MKGSNRRSKGIALVIWVPIGILIFAVLALRSAAAWVGARLLDLLKLAAFFVFVAPPLLLYMAYERGPEPIWSFLGYPFALWKLRGRTFFVYTEKLRFRAFVESTVIGRLPPDIDVVCYGDVHWGERPDARLLRWVCDRRGKTTFPLVMHVRPRGARFATVVHEVEFGVRERYPPDAVVRVITETAERLRNAAQ